MMLAACPGDEPAATESGTDPTDATQGSPTTTGGATETPTTGAPTTGTTTDDSTTTDATTDTTGETTTTGGDGVVTRVLYYPAVLANDYWTATAVRYVEVVDGVAGPPVTVLEPGGGQTVATTDAVHGGRWSPYYTPPPEAPTLWLVDMDSLTAHEIALPAEAERVVTARLSRDETHLIVWVAPLGSSDGADYQYYVCELGPAAECTLEAVESALGPTTYIDAIHDISGATGRIWYTAVEVDGTAQTVLQGDVAAPADAITLAEFPDVDSGGFSFVSLDEKTIYFNLADGAETHAMDIGVDPPGPLVSLHPPLPGVRRRWSDDEKDLLLYVADGLYGDLSLVAVDGVDAGPMIDLNTGGPSHVAAKHLQWISDRRVLFLGDIDTPMENQLYMLDAADPDAPPVRVNGDLQATGTVNDVFMRGDPLHAIYYAQDDDQTPNEIFRVRLEPPFEAHKFNAPLADGTFLLGGAFNVSADGQRVIYGGSEVADRQDLFLVDFDGEVPAPAINLTSGLADEVHLLGHLAPDAAQAFFAGDAGINEAGALYMVPLSPAVGPPQAISEAGERVREYYVLPAK